MLKDKFIIPKYNWKVYIYYHIDCYYIDEIIERLRSIGCSNNYITDAYNSMISCELNTGFIYSNSSKRCSVIIISNTSSPAQFMNSYDHEHYHLVTHILEEFNIDPYSEEAAYLTGDIGQLMFPKAKRFLCKCYCK